MPVRCRRVPDKHSRKQPQERSLCAAVVLIPQEGGALRSGGRVELLVHPEGFAQVHGNGRGLPNDRAVVDDPHDRRRRRPHGPGLRRGRHGSTHYRPSAFRIKDHRSGLAMQIPAVPAFPCPRSPPQCPVTAARTRQQEPAASRCSGGRCRSRACSARFSDFLSGDASSPAVGQGVDSCSQRSPQRGSGRLQ